MTSFKQGLRSSASRPAIAFAAKSVDTGTYIDQEYNGKFKPGFYTVEDKDADGNVNTWVDCPAEDLGNGMQRIWIRKPGQ